MTMAGESSGRRDCDGEVSGKSQRKVGLVYDETMCKHDTPDGEDHPECPDRIRIIWEKLQLAGVTQRCVVLGGSKAEDKHLQLVHTKEHVNLVKGLSTKQRNAKRNKIASQFDSICLNGGSSEAAYLAAGSVLKLAEKVAEGELDCGFAIVRPPGHHAEADEAMGFCLFNNVAVAASYLLNERPDLGVKKILIVDWDVHHGNGIQKMFWKDPRVLFFSVHRYEQGSFYPTGDDGSYDMVGEGLGKGFNINVPWEQGGCKDSDYVAVWDRILIPVAKEFNPDIILLAAGFDAAIDDPLGGCCVTPYGYSVMLKKLMEFAQGKIVMALEGGYNLESTAKCSLACVQVLIENKPIEGSSNAYPFESTWRVIHEVRKRLYPYWPSLSDELSWKLFRQNIPKVTSSRSLSEIENYIQGFFKCDLMMASNMRIPIDLFTEPAMYRHFTSLMNQLISTAFLTFSSFEHRVMRKKSRRNVVRDDELKTAKATISKLNCRLREKEKEHAEEVSGLRSISTDLENAKAKLEKYLH